MMIISTYNNRAQCCSTPYRGNRLDKEILIAPDALFVYVKHPGGALKGELILSLSKGSDTAQKKRTHIKKRQ